MTKLLTKLFIKNYTDTKDPKVREAYGKLSGFVGILCTVFLFIINLKGLIIKKEIL